MKFRPCIDIHNGKVKQIVGGSLNDTENRAIENFVSEKDAVYYAKLYRLKNLKGGHIIMLNSKDSEFFEATKKQALNALNAYRGGLMAGGGINDKNAGEYIEAGASHIIVTSYVFNDAKIYYDRLEKLCRIVGKKHLVLDLSCKNINGRYRIVTDRWQKITNEEINYSLLDRLSDYCDEFLIHAVDVEGKAEGIEEELITMLGAWGKKKITYAGGVHSFEDLKKLHKCGNGKLDVTIGSALDIFGGNMEFDKVLECISLL